MHYTIGLFVMGLLFSPALSDPAAAQTSPVKVENLRCEYLVDPLGIDTMEPRLSWILKSERRGEVQTAYQVLVAKSRESLARDVGDLWDSGKVRSSQTSQVTYMGESLHSRQQCFWKVKIWDASGAPSAFSQTATWEMGLLRPQEWSGKWIGTGRKVKPVCSLQGTKVISRADMPVTSTETLSTSTLAADAITTDGAGITTATADASSTGAQVTSATQTRRKVAKKAAPKRPPVSAITGFRQKVEIPSDRKPLTARLRFASRTPVTILWNGTEIGVTSGKWTDIDVLDVMNRITPGEHVVAAICGDKKTESALAGQLEVVFETGGVYRVLTDKNWQAAPVTKDKTKAWVWDETLLTGTLELAEYGDKEWPRGPEPDARINSAPAPLLRRNFDVDGEVVRARLSVCGLGYHELSLNGKPVSDNKLDPAYTAFHKRALYVTHDVTTAVKTGKNAIGVMLGCGWYDVHTLAEWNFDSAPWRNTPRLMLDLTVDLADGRTIRVGSDEKWKWADGPVTFNSIYEGESYDARKEVPGWDTAEFNDMKWAAAEPVAAPEGKLRAQMMPSIRSMETITPVKVKEPKPGVFVYDLGRNIAGVPRITFEGAAGKTITLKCGERLLPDGTVDQKEIAVYTVGRDPRQRFQADSYTLKGKGSESWEPRFTYHGFQYVEVSGSPKPCTLDNLRGQVWHTDLKQTTRFSCSNPLFNSIWDATLAAYRGNLHGIPTDCPTREKNGWTGDAHLAAEVGLYAFDSPAFYTKWLNDLKDAQLSNGDLPGIVPSGGWGYEIGIGPAWDSVTILIPWHLYEYCGDKAILANHYDSMRQYIEYLGTRADDYIVSYGLGDWVPFDTHTSAALTSTAYYFRDARILSEVAGLLGNPEDERKYSNLASRIKKAFNERFYHADTGLYDNGSQTAQSCALFQGLVEPNQKERVLEELIRAIEKRDYHIDTGILGSKYVPNVLLDAGRADLVYRMAAQKTLPGWGWMIEQGATTLWEQWRGTDSRNHIMFGDISAWFVKALAGIRADKPGFAHFIIKPHVVADLTSASAEYESIAGRIASEWKVEAGRITLKVTIPPNTSATVHVPAKDTAQVTEGGVAIASVAGIKPAAGKTQGAAVFEVPAGSYRFEAPY